jgi:tetratricopeptide (TPR) repeat protein
MKRELIDTITKGNSAFKQQKYSEATELYKEVLVEASKNLNRIGLLSQENIKEVQWYSLCIRLSGNALFKNGQLSEADLGDREMVLTTAKTFEDTGVAAYNGAGQLLKDKNLLLVAGKIVSVEARHVSTLRDLLDPLSEAFAGDDVINEMGLDQAKMPPEVLAAVQPFVKETIDGSDLPTS